VLVTLRTFEVVTYIKPVVLKYVLDVAPVYMLYTL